MSNQTVSSTTQQYLDIFDITNDLVLMKNGTTSIILSVDAMNFGLLAEEEQDSIIYAYAGLLNSLNYPIQILIRSQTKDVTSYLSRLKEQENRAGSRERQDRIRRYREFVSNLIRERNVLDKKFYVIVPASPLELGLVPIQSVMPGKQQFDISAIDRSVILEKAKNLLEPKRDHLTAQFARIGLYSYQLTTQEIIQLYYLSYNPEASEGQHIAESRSYTTPLVRASFEGILPTQGQQTARATPQNYNQGAGVEQNIQVAPDINTIEPPTQGNQNNPDYTTVEEMTADVVSESQEVIAAPNEQINLQTQLSEEHATTTPQNQDETTTAQEEINQTIGQIGDDLPGGTGLTPQESAQNSQPEPQEVSQNQQL